MAIIDRLIQKKLLFYKSGEFVGYSYKLWLMKVIIIAYTVDKIRLSL